jgi:hypothetical protein
VLLGIALLVGLAPSAAAAEPPVPASRLDSPMGDLAVLPPAPGAPPETTPMLLVLDADRVAPNLARMSVLRRGSAWDRIAVLDIDLEAGDLDDAWLVDLGESRFALIATSPRGGPEPDRRHNRRVRHDLTPRPRLGDVGRPAVDGPARPAGPRRDRSMGRHGRR